MHYEIARSRAQSLTFVLIALFSATLVAHGQNSAVKTGVISRDGANRPAVRDQPLTSSSDGLPIGASSALSRYADPVQGASSNDLIRRALAANAGLAAARLDIERGRARLRQAALRPNPSFEFEQTTGRFTGSAGDRQTSIGIALPLELGGKRQRRIDLARVELEAAEAEVADRERRLAAEVRAAYAEGMTALRELETTEDLNNVDLQTARIVEARVTEGESAPLELNLLRVEVDRLRSRCALVEGRLQAALLRLKALAGIPLGDPLRLREDLASPVTPDPPSSLEAAVDIALRARPDLRLARLVEEAALAGLRLAQAQAAPDVTAVARYSFGRSITDLPAPLAPFPDSDRLLSFGVSIGIPVFNRNQGAQAEAQMAIAQAQKRREFLEALVKSEVASAYVRYQAATSSLATFSQGVLARSAKNIESIRGAYEIGAFRVTDLLVEQRRYVDSQREFIEALAERYRALADLQAAIGAPVK